MFLNFLRGQRSLCPPVASAHGFSSAPVHAESLRADRALNRGPDLEAFESIQ